MVSIQNDNVFNNKVNIEDVNLEHVYIIKLYFSPCQKRNQHTIRIALNLPAGKCTYNVRTLYVQARTYIFGTDNIRNESFLDIRVHTYNVRT